MQLDVDKIYEFANRLRYTPVNSLPNDIYVDHVNKEYDKNAYPCYVLFDIILWNTPQFVYNILKISLKNTFKYNMTNYHLVEAILFSDSIIISNNYRNANLYNILHPCIDSSLRVDFNKVISILLSKVFDDKDSYFNISYSDKSEILTIEPIIKQYKEFLSKVANTDFVLSGSLNISIYGYIYREAIKDFDFIVDIDKLDKDFVKYVVNNFKNNQIINKNREEIEKVIKDKFNATDYFNKLKIIFDNELIIKSAVIDRLSTYDNIAKLTFTLKYKDIEFDLIFRNNVIYDYKDIDGIRICCQNINDSLYTKRLLGRPKDFQDLINFKPYFKLNNNFKCVVNYE